MKKIFSLIFVLLLFVFCFNNFAFAQTYSELKAEKKEIKETAQEKEYAFAHKIKIKKYTKSDYYHHVIMYDKHGNTIEDIKNFENNSENKRCTFKFDENDNLTEECYFGPYNGTPTKTEYSYDKNNNKIKKVEYDARMKLSQITSWVYGKSGLLDEKITINWRRDTAGIIKYEYDKNKRIIKAKQYLNTKIFNYLYEYKFDSRNNVIECLFYDNVGLIRIEKQAFDDRGNEIWIYKESIIGKKDMMYENTKKGNRIRNDKYEYDEYNNQILSVDFEGRDTINGDCLSRTKFIYDLNGNILKEYDISPENEQVLQKEFEYDESGNKIKETDYGFNNEITREVLFIYDGKGCLLKECSSYNDTEEEKEEDGDDDSVAKEDVKNTVEDNCYKYEFEYYE